MRWKGRRQSSNIQDRRRAGPGRGPGGATVALGGGSIVTLLLVMGVIWIAGGNPLSILQSQGGSGPNISLPGSGAQNAPIDPAQEELAQFIATVLADTEDVWNKLFAESGSDYREPSLVLFRGQTRSGCGFASASSGPFYCPADQQIYIDLAFYDELANKFGAPGDFAQAYVIAHEVGHHIQHMLGTTDEVHAQKGRVSETEYNDLSVRLELQADFLAGVWAHHADRSKNILERGDLEEGLRAAAAIGDDTLQKRAQGYAVPDSFTHGSSAQRVRWFRLGLESGDLTKGDTFSVASP